MNSALTDISPEIALIKPFSLGFREKIRESDDSVLSRGG
jgi:hypothetical protein